MANNELRTPVSNKCIVFPEIGKIRGVGNKGRNDLFDLISSFGCWLGAHKLLRLRVDIKSLACLPAKMTGVHKFP